MRFRTRRAAIVLQGLALAAVVSPACGQHDRGVVYVDDATSNAFGHALPALDAKDRRAFAVGNALFRSNWIPAPASAAGLDGLGPLFNARSCSACHLLDGRSKPPAIGDDERSGLLLRIGVRVPGAPDAPHPVYGDQLQDAAIPGVVPEGRVDVAWRVLAGTYGDGDAFELLEPAYELRDPGYGAFGDVVLGARTAPHLVGLGLIEAIPEAELRQRADPDDRDRDGVSGRVHVLADGRIGRFGWKATQPTVRDQVAAAFVHDMGITSSLQPRESLSRVESDRITSPSGGDPEIPDDKLERVVFYSRTLAVPAARDDDSPTVRAGESAFTSFGCAVCHVPQWTTSATAEPPALAGQRITPYSDLLLHDLGPGLADGKRDGDARPSEWRTPPLWGLGLLPAVNGHERLLHDGRARGPAEAILWHGGEAAPARERFRLAPRERRDALVAFLRSR